MLLILCKTVLINFYAYVSTAILDLSIQISF
jgi:hypothetical protein